MVWRRNKRQFSELSTFIEARVIKMVGIVRISLQWETHYCYETWPSSRSTNSPVPPEPELRVHSPKHPRHLVPLSSLTLVSGARRWFHREAPKAWRIEQHFIDLTPDSPPRSCLAQSPLLARQWPSAMTKAGSFILLLGHHNIDNRLATILGVFFFHFWSW